jgi:hypothetical protein
MIAPVNGGSDGAHAQAATSVMMVRPARFASNPQTSQTNRFQHAEASGGDAANRAVREFEALRQAVAAAGIDLCVIDDTPEPAKPDAVFPNNWVSFHPDGTVVLYPMLAPNRRFERRLEVVEAVQAQLHFRRRRLLDLSVHEREGRFLEGTGSLVLDTPRGLAYASRSGRTDESLVREWARQMGYEPVIFDATGSDGTPIYHTNVVLSIGSRYVIVCSEVIASADRARVLASLGQHHDVIQISQEAMLAFGANILELRSAGRDKAVLMLSARAAQALQRLPNAGWQRLSAAVDHVVPVAVPTIEDLGGGGVRCMLAEVPQVQA